MEYDYGKNKEESPEPAEADIAGECLCECVSVTAMMNHFTQTPW